MKPRQEKKMLVEPAATSHARRPPSGAGGKTSASSGVIGVLADSVSAESVWSMDCFSVWTGTVWDPWEWSEVAMVRDCVIVMFICFCGGSEKVVVQEEAVVVVGVSQIY